MRSSHNAGSAGGRPGGLLAAMVETLVIFLLVGMIIFVVFTVLGQAQPGGSSLPNTALGAAATPTRALNGRHEPTPTARSFTLTEGLPTPTLEPNDPKAFPSVYGYAPFPLDVNPLTGMKVDDITRLERRPVMVKVSNYPRTGRPHAGLSFADIVFEYYIGYDLNRFAAIYLGTDCPKVGPIRSGRLVDAQLAELYQSILVYGNADPTIDEVIVGELGKRALAEKYLPTPPKYRIGPVPETNLFVNTAEISEYVTDNALVSNLRRDLRGMVFGDQLDPKSQIGRQVGVQYGGTTRGEWHYDPDKGKYLGWIEEPKGDDDLRMIPWVDRLTKEQLAFSNVVILFTEYIEYAPTKHDIKLYNNHGGKRAIFFRDGLMVEGQWRTPGNGYPIQFMTPFGAPYQLKPGNTWVVLAGDSSSFNEKSEGEWEMLFDLP